MAVTEAQRLECLKKYECTTKDAALKKLKKKIDRYVKDAETELQFPKSYYALVAFLLSALYKKISAAIIFDELPDYWIYDFDYEYDEFCMNLIHVKKYDVDDDLEFKSYTSDAVYKMISVLPASFSVEEYSKYYDVEQGTVRQWIRRGKIRSAYKTGTEWKIPELTPPPSRGYEGAQYKWFSGIDNLPEEYAFLKDYVIATFYQDRKEKTKFHVLLVARETFSSDDKTVAKAKNRELLLDSKEREKMELFMISHPQIKYCGYVI